MSDIKKSNEITRPFMTTEEAHQCVEQINSNLSNTRELLLDLYEREGWVSLGYKSWRECVVKEFKQNENYLYKQLAAAQTERNICTIVQKQIPEGQLRLLSKLDPDQQKEAWQTAVETAPEGKVTARHVETVVDNILGKTQPLIESEKMFSESDSKNLFTLKNCWQGSSNRDRKKFITWINKFYPEALEEYFLLFTGKE
ncbi:MAG: hypothetical protein KKB31_01325 [Nanoarchaeota archaeon]|nr:hypothetical protein [Nanoarchaeota archaeon]